MICIRTCHRSAAHRALAGCGVVVLVALALSPIVAASTLANATPGAASTYAYDRIGPNAPLRPTNASCPAHAALTSGSSPALAARSDRVRVARATTTIATEANYGYEQLTTFAEVSDGSPPRSVDSSACLTARAESALAPNGLAPSINVAAEEGSALNGEFSIVDWSGYPEGVPRPTGPFRLLNGEEYDTARAAANDANAALRRQLPADVRGAFDIHEIQPVKFGGSPTDLANKVLVDRATHRQLITPWWNNLQRSLGG